MKSSGKLLSAAGPLDHWHPFRAPWDDGRMVWMRIRCSAPGCDKAASCEVILYDVYLDGAVFFERDMTCPYLCAGHIAKNEVSLHGVRKPRGRTSYLFSNRHGAQGFTINKPLA